MEELQGEKLIETLNEAGEFSKWEIVEPLDREEQDWLDRQMYMQDDRGYYDY